MLFLPGTRFGAMLDMLTDRCATMCLLVNLAMLYPESALLFQLSMSLDVASHWLHLHRYQLGEMTVIALPKTQGRIRSVLKPRLPSESPAFGRNTLGHTSPGPNLGVWRKFLGL